MEYCDVSADSTHMIQSIKSTAVDRDRTEVIITLSEVVNRVDLTPGIIELTFGINQPCIKCQQAALRTQKKNNTQEPPTTDEENRTDDSRKVRIISARDAREEQSMC